MLFKVTKDNISYQVDDLKVFDIQSKKFKEAFNKLEQSSLERCVLVQFDNGTVTRFDTGRVLVNIHLTDNQDDENI